MDEEKKIMEKRSSFRGWKERNKGKIQQKRNITLILIIISVFFILAAYSYWDKIDSDSHTKQQNKTSSSVSKDIKTNLSNNSKNDSGKNLSKIVNLTNLTNATKNSTAPKKNIIGKIGVPLVSNGFEITIKSVTSAGVYTSVWVIVRNKENIEKPFKLGADTILMDNIGQQYENIKIARAGIAQTNLSAKAMREGAVFFEGLKEGRNPKRVILNINNENSEFTLS